MVALLFRSVWVNRAFQPTTAQVIRAAAARWYSTNANLQKQVENETPDQSKASRNLDRVKMSLEKVHQFRQLVRQSWTASKDTQSAHFNDIRQRLQLLYHTATQYKELDEQKKRVDATLKSLTQSQLEHEACVRRFEEKSKEVMEENDKLNEVQEAYDKAHADMRNYRDQAVSERFFKCQSLLKDVQEALQKAKSEHHAMEQEKAKSDQEYRALQAEYSRQQSIFIDSHQQYTDKTQRVNMWLLSIQVVIAIINIIYSVTSFSYLVPRRNEQFKQSLKEEVLKPLTTEIDKLRKTTGGSEEIKSISGESPVQLIQDIQDAVAKLKQLQDQHHQLQQEFLNRPLGDLRGEYQNTVFSSPQALAEQRMLHSVATVATVVATLTIVGVVLAKSLFSS